ncbi:hypothetical protein ACIQUQ_30135 [Streptomyces sp. NPDC101118]|uniref:hypothetical protein n=1 Tax=Streptomyces sp. NPDC101118 TaxID=3366109 RepID=UPI0037F95A0F
MSWAVRLYPASFRREFGDEVAEVYRESTRDAGPLGRMRETGDVVGHALRMRLGLGSAGRCGGWFAAVAPFALVAVGAAALWQSGLLFRVGLGGGATFGAAGTAYTLVAAGGLVTVAGAVLALAGRWAAGCWLALAGVAGTLAADAWRQGAGAVGAALFTTGPLLLLLLVTLACPPDLRPVPRVRSAGGAVAVAAWGVVLSAAVVAVPLPYAVSWLRFLVPVAGGLLLAGRQAFVRLRTAPAVLAAGLPFLVLAELTGALAAYLVLPLLLLVLAAAVAVSVRRRRGGSGPLVGA